MVVQNAFINVKDTVLNYQNNGAIEIEYKFELSYESDGKMGEKENNNGKENKDQAEIFFNGTQDSE
ncbi:hypothetical protein LIS77_11205 [Cytobacillus firmus]|uniref:hypothetical protein n=1 Tax=Cytobacillus firmus TaxID=1399 RepID=UPI00207A6552|nr:hypothetical protein [Cytobacillus firmus]USK41025.1 hypothetical protein LIS77_11205 [Cytobacillus firmus]